MAKKSSTRRSSEPQSRGYISVRVGSDLKQLLADRAAALGLSLATYCLFVLTADARNELLARAGLDGSPRSR